MQIFWPSRISPMIGVVMGRTYWALRSPWSRALFSERNDCFDVYPIGFGWRLTKQKLPQ